jgi:hypothetical protein
VRGKFKLRLAHHPENRVAAGPFIGFDDKAVGIFSQKPQHDFPRPRGRDVFIHLRAQEQRVRDASDRAMSQDFRRGRLVIRDSMRNRIIQSEIITESEMPLRPALHDDEPALGSGFDRDAVTVAIPGHGIDECSVGVEHF